MPTFEESAEELAFALASAHEALGKVTKKMSKFVLHEGFGSRPITSMTFINEAKGLEGALGRLHLNITPFDPRPSPFDGGGK